MNRLIISNEFVSVIKKLPKNRSPGPDEIPKPEFGEFYQTLKEEFVPILKTIPREKRKEISQIYYMKTLL